jgi:hypothetical protein
MDEESIKAAFKEWLYRLCEKNGWVNRDGKVVIARIAEYFQVSRQTVTNWLLGVSCLSTQKVNQVIAPRMGIGTAQFWYEMQVIDRELKGLSPHAETHSTQAGGVPRTADEIMNCIMGMPQREKERVKKLLLIGIAQGEM